MGQNNNKPKRLKFMYYFYYFVYSVVIIFSFYYLTLFLYKYLVTKSHQHASFNTIKTKKGKILFMGDSVVLSYGITGLFFLLLSLIFIILNYSIDVESQWAVNLFSPIVKISYGLLPLSIIGVVIAYIYNKITCDNPIERRKRMRETIEWKKYSEHSKRLVEAQKYSKEKLKDCRTVITACLENDFGADMLRTTINKTKYFRVTEKGYNRWREFWESNGYEIPYEGDYEQLKSNPDFKAFYFISKYASSYKGPFSGDDEIIIDSFLKTMLPDYKVGINNFQETFLNSYSKEFPNEFDYMKSFMLEGTGKNVVEILYSLIVDMRDVNITEDDYLDWLQTLSSEEKEVWMSQGYQNSIDNYELRMFTYEKINGSLENLLQNKLHVDEQIDLGLFRKFLRSGEENK